MRASRRRRTFSTFAFGRDRRDRLAWIYGRMPRCWPPLMPSTALIAHARARWRAALLGDAPGGLPLVAFIVGRTLPCAVSPLLGSIRLPPERRRWPPSGLRAWRDSVFSPRRWLPTGWRRPGSPSCGRVESGQSRRALFAAMGAGIAAYLAGPILLYAEEDPVINIILMSVSVIVLAYLLGRTLDYSDPLPLSLAFVPLILRRRRERPCSTPTRCGWGLPRRRSSRRGRRSSPAARSPGRRSRTLKRNADDSLADQSRIGGGVPPTSKS